jgi:hypothetical protein
MGNLPRAERFVGEIAGFLSARQAPSRPMILMAQPGRRAVLNTGRLFACTITVDPGHIKHSRICKAHQRAGASGY